VRSARELLTTGADSALRTVRLSRRVRRLEEGVQENALLAGPLEEHVARIEQSLVPLLAATSPLPAGAPEAVAPEEEVP
jgi:hypothetical protein